MNLRFLCVGLALCATVLTSGCRSTARRYSYSCPPAVVSYSPVATPCCPPAPCAPAPVVMQSSPVVAAPGCAIR